MTSKGNNQQSKMTTLQTHEEIISTCLMGLIFKYIKNSKARKVSLKISKRSEKTFSKKDIKSQQVYTND